MQAVKSERRHSDPGRRRVLVILGRDVYGSELKNEPAVKLGGLCRTCSQSGKKECPGNGSPARVIFLGCLHYRPLEEADEIACNILRESFEPEL